MDQRGIKHYSIYKEACFHQAQRAEILDFCGRHGLEGMEIFMDDLVPRDRVLFGSEAEKEAVVKKLIQLNVKRIHCSYWAYPTSFLTKNNFQELCARFCGEEKIIEYYGDLTGEHLFQRWMQEYEVAGLLGAQAYTFHLIDYAPIDGKWEFTIPRQEILQAMIFMLQQFLNLLTDRGLLTDRSPRIEIENAGWGLEYGVQSAEDYKTLFRQLYDPFDRVRIGWDINHLLHALGYDRVSNRARFFLPDAEITSEMREMEEKFGGYPWRFAEEWVRYHIESSGLLQKTGSFHVSDCKLKETEYFSKGRLTGKYYEELMLLEDWEKQEEYGVGIVLAEYDSHEILGKGILSPRGMKALIERAVAGNPEIVLLHELKNSKDQEAALYEQLKKLESE